MIQYEKFGGDGNEAAYDGCAGDGRHSRSRGEAFARAFGPRFAAEVRAGEYDTCDGHVPPALPISRGTLTRFVLTEIERIQFVHTVVGISA
jgi:hypothetical protein